PPHSTPGTQGTRRAARKSCGTNGHESYVRRTTSCRGCNVSRPLLDAWHPQLWVRVILKVDDFRPQPYSPVPPPIEGDPIDIADPLLGAFIILPNSASITRNSYRRADECS